MSSAVSTTNHETIRNWVEDRGGHPAKVKGSEEGGILRIDFGVPAEELEKIGWDEFFRIFEENGLAFLHQDETDTGGTSRFNKFIERG